MIRGYNMVFGKTQCRAVTHNANTDRYILLV